MSFLLQLFHTLLFLSFSLSFHEFLALPSSKWTPSNDFKLDPVIFRDTFHLPFCGVVLQICHETSCVAVKGFLTPLPHPSFIMAHQPSHSSLLPHHGTTNPCQLFGLLSPPTYSLLSYPVLSNLLLDLVLACLLDAQISPYNGRDRRTEMPISWCLNGWTLRLPYRERAQKPCNATAKNSNILTLPWVHILLRLSEANKPGRKGCKLKLWKSCHDTGQRKWDGRVGDWSSRQAYSTHDQWKGTWWYRLVAWHVPP